MYVIALSRMPSILKQIVYLLHSRRKRTVLCRVRNQSGMNAVLSHQYDVLLLCSLLILFDHFYQIELERLTYQAILKSGAVVELSHPVF